MTQGMSFPARVRAAWRSLAPDQRLAAVAAGGLFVTMLLPWYTKDIVYKRPGAPPETKTLAAFQSFSFVELAVLLVALGVLLLLFQRAEGKPFHLPGGDGGVIAAAGIWICLLVFYRFVDNKSGTDTEIVNVDYGVTWGIFVTFLVAAVLASAGLRMRAIGRPEPPAQPPEHPPPPDPPPTRRMTRSEAPTSVARRRPRIDGGDQLSFDEQE
jgi:hypothetical protein